MIEIPLPDGWITGMDGEVIFTPGQSPNPLTGEYFTETGEQIMKEYEKEMLKNKLLLASVRNNMNSIKSKSL